MGIQRQVFCSFLLAIVAAQATPSPAAVLTWDGGGTNNNWSTAANWNPNSAPVANDSLSFDGVNRLSTNNNLAAGTQINGLTFNATAGAFTLAGNSLTLHGDIADNRAVRPQTVSLNLALDATRSVDVTAGGALTLSGLISGAGFGLTKTGQGTLTLTNLSNSFSGPLTVLAGTVQINDAPILGTGPIVINGGVLQTTGAVDPTIIPSIALGPSAGSGFGSIEVFNNNLLVHSLTNNGVGSGGLIKQGTGTLLLDAVNTYSGPTIIKQGRITLDFTGVGGPTSNLIPSTSPLTIAPSTPGRLATRSYSTIRMEGDTASATSQTFASTLFDVGAVRVLVNNSAGVTTNLNLAAITHNPGAIAVFAMSNGSHATTTAANIGGILGGWATVGTITSTSVVTDSDIARGTAWASNDGSGNIVPYTFQPNETYVTGDVLHTDAAFLATNRNLQITTGSTGNIVVNTAGAGTTTDMNTVEIAPSTTNLLGRFLDIGAANTLRLGKSGGFFRADFSTAPVDNSTPPQSFEIGTPSGTPDRGLQDVGTLTAGGAPNTSGEIAFTINAPSQTNAQTNVDAKITDNGTGVVSVIKAGAGSMKLRGNNTYSGGTFIIGGRVQLAGSDVGTSNAGGFGTGTVTVLNGGQAMFSNADPTTVTNDLRIAGNGLDDEGSGAIRLAGGTTLAGTITLLDDSRIAGGGTSTGFISGEITGPHGLIIGSPGFLTTLITLTNPLNDWTGDTTIMARNSSSNFNTLFLGASEVIPDGYEKGDFILQGSNTAGAQTTFRMNGFSETVNGLVSSGTVTTTNMIIENDTPSTTSTLTVGNSDQTATYAGVIRNNNGSGGAVAFKKIGLGTQTLSGANTYGGTTTVDAGTLLVNGSHTGAGSYFVDADATLGGIGSIAFAGGSSLEVAGTLSPGASIESLDVTGNVAFDATSVLTIELSGGLIDLVNVNGDISVANGAIAQFLVTGTPTLSQYVFATYTGGLLGGFTSTSVPAGYSLVQGGGQLRLVQVPEPATWLLAAAGLLGMAQIARSRRRVQC